MSLFQGATGRVTSTYLSNHPRVHITAAACPSLPPLTTTAMLLCRSIHFQSNKLCQCIEQTCPPVSQKKKKYKKRYISSNCIQSTELFCLIFIQFISLFFFSVSFILLFCFPFLFSFFIRCSSPTVFNCYIYSSSFPFFLFFVLLSLVSFLYHLFAISLSLFLSLLFPSSSISFVPFLPLPPNQSIALIHLIHS